MSSKKRFPSSEQASSVAKKSSKNHEDRSQLLQKTATAEFEEEEDFPRGSATILTPLEIKSAHEEARRDVTSGSTLFGTPKTEKTAKKKRTKEDILQIAPGAKKGRNFHSEIKFPSPKSLKTGVLLLGCVKEIREFEVILSLPFNIQVQLSHANISDPISEIVVREIEMESEDEEESLTDRKDSLPELKHLFYVGQYLVCRVIGVKDKKISVSINPRLINEDLTGPLVFKGMVLPGWVESVEDHGILVSFGIEGVKGFLEKTSTLEYSRQHLSSGRIHLGQVFTCMVTSVKNLRAVGVCIDPKEINFSTINPDEVFSATVIIPGMLVSASMEEVYENCLRVKFLGGFEGFISCRHLPGTTVNTGKMKAKNKLKAKVLWVDRGEKQVGLTLKAPTVSGEQYLTEDMVMGTIIDEARVVHQDKNKALMLDLGNGHLGFSPISMVYEKRMDAFEKRHKIGSTHRCRVVSFNTIDCSAVVSLKQSVLEEEFLSYSDLKPGDTVEGRIHRHGSYGMIVQVNQYIQGLCPTLHLADNKLKHPEKKLKSGNEVKCRVLDVDPVRLKLTLTHKRTLVESKLPVLSSYDGVKVGEVHHGFIRAINDWGCVVHFFNHVKGIVNRSDLGIPFDVDPKMSFKEGQVVSCRILFCEPRAKKLRLTLEVDQAASSTPLEPGQILPLKVEGISPEGITLRSPGGEPAYLPKLHLSDHSDLCDAILRSHQTSLDEATGRGRHYEMTLLVVCQKLPMRQALVTCKQSLFEEARENRLILNFDQLKIGLILVGFVKKSERFGVFVEFPGNLLGLCPNKYVKDEFISDSIGVFSNGQTVRAKVMELDADKKRIILNMRCSDLKFSLTGQGWKNTLSERLRQYLREREAALKIGSSQLEQHSIGRVREAKVVEIDEDHKLIHLELTDGTPAVAPIATRSSGEYDSGQDARVVVVDLGSPLPVSLSSKLLDSATSPDPLSSATKKKSKKKQKVQTGPSVPPLKVDVSSKVLATLEYLSSDHCVCSVTTLNGTGLAYAVFDNGQYNGRPLSMPYLQVGRTVRGVVHQPGDEGTYGLPTVVISGDASSEQPVLESHQSLKSFSDINLGDVVDALVVGVSDSQVDVRSGSLKGRVHISMVTDTCTDGDSPLTNYKPNDIIKARVLKIRKSPGHPAVLELCTRQSVLQDESETFSDDKCTSILCPPLIKGQQYPGVVKSVTSRGLNVYLSPTCVGHIPAQLVSQDHNVVEALNLYFTKGQVLQCGVVEKKSSDENHTPKLSLTGFPKPPTPGDTVVAKVIGVQPEQGLSVSIATFFIGSIHITDLADKYTNNPTSKFKCGEFLKCVVIEKKKNRYILSLRPSRMGGDVTPTDLEVTSLTDVTEGAIMRGFVKASSKHGIFVWIGREVCGRVKFANLTDGFVEKPLEHLSQGELIKFKVLSVDGEKNQLELSLRESHLDPKAAKKKARARAELKKKHERQKKKSEEKVLLAEEDDSSDEDAIVDDSGVDSVVSDDGDDDGMEMIVQAVGPRLDAGEFKWDTGGTEDDQDHDGSDSGDGEDEAGHQVPAKSTKRQRKAAKKLEEQKLYEMELAQLDINRPLETADDYERLVVTSPDSSSAWIHYILYHLTSAEVEKAKAVAQRALSTIAYNKESEKLNIWIALLNLENMYGTPQSLSSVFQSALQQNDPEKVYWKMIAIYKKSNKLELADELFKTMVKKFGTQLKVWTGYAEFLMGRGHYEAARRVLERSLKSLPKAQHVEMIVKFAEFEYKMGDPSRGQTLFENVVANYPKRLDVWSRYFDMSIKQPDKETTRMLFERAIQLKLSAKKMKFFFNRYLDFERNYGTVATVEAVREKAGEFVDRHVQVY